MPIVRNDDPTWYDTHGSRFAAYVNPTRGSHQLSAWRLEVPPSTTGVPHRPTREEVLLVLSGQLLVTLDGEPGTAGPGDVVLVPAGSELRVDSGPDGCSAWVTSTPGLEAVTTDGARVVPPWAN